MERFEPVIGILLGNAWLWIHMQGNIVCLLEFAHNLTSKCECWARIAPTINALMNFRASFVLLLKSSELCSVVYDLLSNPGYIR